MPKLTHRLMIMILFIMLFLNGCSAFAVPTNPPPIPGLAQTLAAQTLTAQQTRAARYATPMPPAAQEELPVVFNEVARDVPSSTNTPFPQLTANENGNPSDIPNSELSEACTNAAEFVKDITVPDYTTMKAGQRFVKTWQFRNVGTCTWTPDYQVIFLWGDRMGAPEQFPLGQTVAPNELVNISLELVAPREGNTYQGNWMFMDAQGNRFGTGYHAREFFWVAIVVGGRRSLSNLGGGLSGCIGGG